MPATSSGPGATTPQPPMWMPMPVQSPRQDLWTTLALWGRIGGLILIFLGTLIAVVAGSVPGGCFTQPTSCQQNFFATVANGILVGKLFWVIGLFFLGGASGIRLNWALKMPTPPNPEEVAWVIHRRRANTMILFLSIGLMLLILLTINLLPPLALNIP